MKYHNTLIELGVIAFYKRNIEAVFRECSGNAQLSSAEHQAVRGGAQAPATKIGGGATIGEEKVWWERVVDDDGDDSTIRVDEQQGR